MRKKWLQGRISAPEANANEVSNDASEERSGNDLNALLATAINMATDNDIAVILLQAL